MIKFAMLGAMLLCSAFGAKAADDLALRGIQLGTELTAYPECPKTGTGALTTYLSEYSSAFPADMKGKACFARGDVNSMKAGGRFIELRNLSRVDPLGTVAGVETIDGRIEYVEITFPSARFDLVNGAAQEKYGKPTRSEVKDFATTFGVPVQGLKLQWTKPGAVVQLEEHREGDKANSYLTLASTRFVDATLERQRKASQDLKAGL